MRFWRLFAAPRLRQTLRGNFKCVAKGDEHPRRIRVLVSFGLPNLEQDAQANFCVRSREARKPSIWIGNLDR